MVGGWVVRCCCWGVVEFGPASSHCWRASRKRRSSVGEARHGYSHGRWRKATGHRAQGRGTAQAHRALGDGPTFNPVCTSSGPVKTAPARKEGAVGLWDAPALRIQDAGCHFNFHSVSRKQR